ncbi:type 1 fimbrial protein [Serratia marcescens]|nr:type 1 fimbrial protein [Serratia marcescens]
MRFNLSAIVVFSCLFSLPALLNNAIGASAGWGRVNMQGAIVDSACAIELGSREQIIDMGVNPLSDFIRDGQGYRKPFSIHLVNCTTQRPGKDDWKKFQVTFDGKSDGDLFGVYGEASGVALQITDASGIMALPGKAMPLLNITPGNRQLNYTLNLKGNNQELKAGKYFALIRFKLDYF